MDTIEIDIEVDDSDLEEAQEKVETYEKESKRVIEEVDTATSESFSKVLSMARGAYLVGLGMVKSTGESISYFFRAMVSSVFHAAQVLTPLITAHATIGDKVAAGIALAGLLTSIGAAIAAEQEQRELARGLRGVDMAFLGVQQLIATLTPSWS